jgi:signal transduction histidine kinase
LQNKILFVTGHNGIYKRIEKIFNNDQHLILSSEKNLNNALKAIKQIEFDLIIIDEKVIEKSDHELLIDITCNVCLENTPIILFRDDKKNIKMQELFNLGINDFINSDFSTDEIKFRILTNLQCRNRFNQLEQSLIISASLIDKLEQRILDNDKLYNQIEKKNFELEKELNKKQEVYAGNLHDLKTPFSSLLGNTQLLLEGYIGELSEEQIKSIKIIENSARKLLELIEQYLENSKLEAGITDVYLNKIDVPFLIESALKDLLVLIENKKLSLVTNVNPPIPDVHVDIRKIIRVIHNLLANAIKNTQEQGKITIEAYKYDTDNVLISIKDTGIGISKENAKKIFDKYEQAGRNVSGSGLGLSICKDIIEQTHKGKIWVESEPGKGSAFFFTLPIIFPASEAESIE